MENTPYTVLHSRRKTVALEITRDARVIVRAPLRMPKRAIEAFVAGHAKWIAEHLEKQRQRAEAWPEPTEAEIRALRERARVLLPGRVAHYADIMGLTPTAVKITSARTRFGSCSGKNSLCFSYLLMRYPPEAIDYVVVHELAHIAHKNHGPNFYALIAQVMPDYQKRRALLRG